MKSNYKRIGDYIREVKIRNKELIVTDLRGINIDKYFMPSVANTIGTDMSKYKVVKKGQFACNRMHVGRDKRLPVALLLGDDSIIVSPAYTVFEVIDESLLNPEYLMMWFSRKEFDRESWFYTDSDVRGGLSLDDFFDIKVPILPIEKQREIVKEYNTILNRMKLNENMIIKMDELAEACYKQLVSDIKEYPEEVYKGILADVVEIKYGKDHNKLDEGNVPVFGSGGIIRYVNKKLYEGESILIPRKGSLGNVMYVNKAFWSVDTMFFSVMKRENIAKYIYYFMKSLDLIGMNSGSAVPSMTTSILNNLPIDIPKKEKLELFEKHVEPIFNYIKICKREINLLTELKYILLGKLS